MTHEDPQWMNDWRVGVRLWVERCGEAILGPGRLELLEAIDRCHSIRAAARELGMSYRRAWLLVDSMNRAAGEELVHRQRGGRDNGAELTARGHEAISVYRALQTRVQRSIVLPPPTSSPLTSSIVHVAAASSLENLLHCLLADFAFHQPGTSVRTVCGASDELANQIINGLGVDLFLSAAEGPLDWIENSGTLALAGRTLFAANRLAAISCTPSFLSLRGPRALLQAPPRRLVLADPSCPLGSYSRAYLEPLGLWNAIRQRALFLDNPRGVLAAIESRQADVGLVYRSDARTADCRILFASRPAQPAIRYIAALTRRGEQSTPARGLLAFLTSARARRRLRGFGFHAAPVPHSQGGT